MKGKSVKLFVFGIVLVLLAGGTRTAMAFSNPGDEPIRGWNDSAIKILSGELADQGVSQSNPELTVSTGNSISGSFDISVRNTGRAGAVFILAATPNWGSHSSSYWHVGSQSPGTKAHTVNVNLVAPSSPGTYYIIAAGMWELSASNVASGTNWAMHNDHWDDGNDLADWNATTIESAINSGLVVVNWEIEREMVKMYVPATAIRVKVIGGDKESVIDLINSVSTRRDVLKRNIIDTSLIEEALKNAQNAYDLGNYEEAYELAQSVQKMADDAYAAQQHIESAQSEIDDAKSIGAEVKEAEAKLKEAKDALNKGNYEYARDWADDASELAKHASIGSVQIKDLKALATKYDERTVVISGTIRDIETVYGEGYTFALDDGSGMISVSYQGSLGDIRDGDRVKASGIFQASTGTVVADDVQKSGVSGVPGFEVIFAIAGLLAVAYLLKRRR